MPVRLPGFCGKKQAGRATWLHTGAPSKERKEEEGGPQAELAVSSAEGGDPWAQSQRTFLRSHYLMEFAPLDSRLAWDCCLYHHCALEMDGSFFTSIAHREEFCPGWTVSRVHPDLV